jgi:hypothetical protein
MSRHTTSDVRFRFDRYAMLLLAVSAFSLIQKTTDLQAADQKSETIVKLGDLSSRVPGDWKEEIPYDPRCYKMYRLGPASGDMYEANVSIYSLGKQPDGSAARQVELWKQEFLPPEGTTMASASKVQVFKLHGPRVTYLDVRGDYKGMPGNVATPRENFRLLGVHLDAPRGDYLIILFGPADTVELYRQGFDNFIKAF